MAKNILIIISVFFAITLRCVAEDAVGNKVSSNVTNKVNSTTSSKPSANTSNSGSSIDEFERQVREVAKRSAAEEKAKQQQAKQQQAQSLSKKNVATGGEQSFQVFRYQRNGTVTFSDRVPFKTPYKVITYTSCYACSITSNIDWYNTKLHLTEFSDSIVEAASLYKVDAAFIRAVIHAESAFNPLARSSKGAMGLMQLMPGTAKDMGVSNTSDPQQNIHGGVKYLAGLLQTFNGNFTLAAAAYNAGPSAVTRYSGIPPYEETKTYVKRVNILLDRYRSKMQVATN